MKKSLWLVIGFLMFVLGLTALILQIVGMNYTFMAFLHRLPPLATFVLYIVLMFAGFIVVYLNATNWRDVTDLQ